MGSRQKYREQVAKYRAEREKNGEPVTCPSGFVWILKPVDVQGFVMTGRMPQSLLEKFLKSAKERGIMPSEMEPGDVPNIESEEALASLKFLRDLVSEACVDPRIVIGGTGDDEIDPSEVESEDFKFIVNWALTHAGVAGIMGLQSFRRDRRTASAGPDSTELRDTPVDLTEHSEPSGSTGLRSGSDDSADVLRPADAGSLSN